MRKSYLISLACLAMVLSAACARESERAAAQDEPEAETLALGRQLTNAFFAGELEPLWSSMTAEMRDAAGGTIKEFETFRKKVDELAGQQTEVVHEEVLRDQELDVYRRVALFNKVTEPMVIQWGLERGGAIADFFIRPAEPAASVTYRTKTELRLPFEDEWYVTAGGRTVEQNQHSVDYSNRFAYDLVSAEEFEPSGPRQRNEDFATWGRPILAPAAGTVAALLDGVLDNVPGEINADATVRMGNFVSIDHGNGEFSVLGHLQMGSLRVTVGQAVRRGEPVGLAGNSGNSNGPHLHYNLQDRAAPNRGKGLPAQFVDFVVDGQFVARGEPVQGQRIRPRTERTEHE
jgi:murein DD-endopeptidase MepM/ murein hydrolase activator NlpD